MIEKNGEKRPDMKYEVMDVRKMAY